MESPDSPANSGMAWLLNVPFGFTTTPEQRLGPDPPYTNPALQANLFFRVFLGILAVVVSWVPARLLWRNGEFAATFFCVSVVLRVIGYIINALIWRNDNVATWYAGYGWCDLQVYLNFAMDTAFNICLFEIMRGLHTKIGLNRVTSLTTSERRRQHLISAAVIFTFPVVQVVLTYLLMLRRYNISTLVGCTTIYHFDWLFFVFYVLPTPVFVMLAAFLAVLVFVQFRKIEKLTREAVHTHDTIMSARQHRVRRKLYFMTLGILVIVVPLTVALFVLNIFDGLEYWNDPYDYDLIHYGPDPFNINFISFTTSDLVRFVDMNINYIPTLTAIVIFFVFGTTTEALNDYRKMLLFFGLGYVLPRLRQEYSPDRRRSGRRSWLSSLSKIFPVRGSTKTTSTPSKKGTLLPISAHVSNTSRSGGSSHREKDQAIASTSARPADTNPWPDLTEQDDAVVPTEQSRQPSRNHWVFRTTINLPHLRLPAIRLLFIGKKKAMSEKGPEDISRINAPTPHIPSIPGLHNTATTEKAPATGVIIKSPHTDANTSKPLRVWNGKQASDYPRVDTRVWSTEDALAEGKPASGSPKRDWVFGGHRRKDRQADGNGNGNGNGNGDETESELESGVVRVETETRVACSESPIRPTLDPAVGTS